jgi:predicted amidophosphoribosyltransferase
MAQMMAQSMQQPGVQAAETMMCPSCSAQIPKGSKFCSQCGAKIGEEMICPNCKADVPEGSKFCPNCGTKIG